jgi:uncharacterized membrane protein
MSDPGVPARVQIGGALSWAFSTLRADLLAFLVLAAIPVVLTAAQGIGTTSIQNVVLDCVNPQSPGQENACAVALSPSALAPVVLSVALVFLAAISQIGVQRGAIRRTRGQAPSFADMLESRGTGAYVGYVLLFRIAFFVGLALCILPGLLVLVFFQFGPYFILDRGMGVMAAARASASLASRHLGPVAIVALMTAFLELIGGLFFGLPMLITLPFTALFTAHVYRQLNAEPVV